MWKEAGTGRGKAKPETVAGLTSILNSVGFKELATETQPFSVGRPYVYLVESVADGNYKPVIRDSPRVEWRARRLESFDRLVREMVTAVGLGENADEIGLPPDPEMAWVSPDQ